MHRTRTFLAKLLLVASLSIGSALAEPQIPKGYRDLVLSDQRHNISLRQNQILTAEQRRIQPVFHWDIPEAQAKAYISKYLDPETEKLVRIEKNGQRFIRFFMVKDDHIDWKGMIQEFGEPQQEYWATRMQSKATYFVWNPDKPELDPFFVKMQRSWTKDVPFVNHSDAAKNAIQTSDYAEEVIRATNYDGSAGSIFPERFGASVKQPSGFTYAISLRSVRPLVAEGVPRGVLHPAHGVIGSQLLAFFARRANLTKENWILGQYIPALAKREATMQLKKNLYFEDHSQNLVLEIDEKTGTNLRDHSRDLADVMVDPAGIGMSETRVPLDPHRLPLNLLNEHWGDSGSKNGEKAGKFFAYYTTQAVTDISESVPFRAKLLAGYVREYLKTAEEILGTAVPISPKAEQLLAALEAEKYDKAKIVDLIREIPEDPELEIDHRAGQFLMQEISDTTTKIRIDQFLSKLPILPKMQKHLANAYQTYGVRHNHPLPGPTDATKVDYGWDGEGIWAIDRESKKPLGYGYGLSDSVKKKLTQRADRYQNTSSSSFACKVRALFGMITGAVPH